MIHGVAAASILLAAGAAVLAFGESTPADPGAGPGPGADLKVMTFNIRHGAADDGENRWPRRKDLLFRTVRDFGSDLLGAQEALDFQVDELRQQLSGYDFVAVGRDDGR